MPAVGLLARSHGRVPEGVDWAALTKRAMDKYSLEIAGGLGPTVGKVRQHSTVGGGVRGL